MSGSADVSLCYHCRMGDGSTQLVREVLPPQKPSSGIGVMIVAATAMFFAVASSAFILRARMVRSSCPGVELRPVIVEAAGADDCAFQVERRIVDGTESFYRVPCQAHVDTRDAQGVIIHPPVLIKSE